MEETTSKNNRHLYFAFSLANDQTVEEHVASFDHKQRYSTTALSSWFEIPVDLKKKTEQENITPDEENGTGKQRGREENGNSGHSRLSLPLSFLPLAANSDNFQLYSGSPHGSSSSLAVDQKAPTPTDYKSLLCSIGYNDKMLHPITRNTTTTCKSRPFSTPSALNYPAILLPNLKSTFSVTRTLTNFKKQRQKSTYRAVVE
ncbi:hypothetical protein L1887_34757 [Cichorium endivia]|nr:hypothetical protein L1887_34757 [Cichorium endivia]